MMSIIEWKDVDEGVCVKILRYIVHHGEKILFLIRFSLRFHLSTTSTQPQGYNDAERAVLVICLPFTPFGGLSR